MFSILLTTINVMAENDSGESRLVFINKLINTSSGARQIIESSDQEAKNLREEAERLYLLSKQEFDADNKDKGGKLLSQATKVMFSAIRHATPDSLGKNKNKTEFNNRMKSVVALHDAFNRIIKDEYDKDSSKKVNQQVEQLKSDANDLFTAGNEVDARTVLDKAYHLLKVSIEVIRRGETLIRSLNFSSKEEEYHYEVDRNNTHKMLVKVLLKDKKKSEYTSKMVNKYTSKSAYIRKQAEQAAENNDYEEAVKLLEQSTKELVRAIRSAGVYIPG